MPINFGGGWSWSGTGAGISGASGAGRRGYTAGWFALELDHQPVPVGFVTHIDGGQFRADALQDHNGQNLFVSKYAGKPKYEDIVVGIGMPNSVRLFNWVKAAIENRPERHTGALVGFDNFQGRKERSRRIFYEALISEITFPALDAASNTPANITIKITPELLKYERGGSVFNAQQARDEAIKQKRWSTQNFGLRLDGIWGGGAKRTTRIDSFTVKQTILTNPAGNRLEDYREPGRVEYPNLNVTFGEENLDEWYRWWKDTVVGGKVSRRSGAISWYGPDLKGELMRLDLDGVSLLNLEVEKYEAGKEQIARAKATLAIEGMKLQRGAGNV